MKKYKHLFFDLDRTIWDFEKNSTETLKEIFVKYDLHKKGIENFEIFHKTYIKHNLKLWELYRQEKISKYFLNVQRFAITLADFNINGEKIAEGMANDYVNISPQKTILFPKTKETLDYLTDKYEMHIITNGFDDVQRKKIKNCGISKYFSSIITSEEAGFKKPNPKIFKYALELNEAALEDSLMIGDDLKIDILGASKYGMDQVYMNYEHMPHNEDITYEIDDFEKLNMIL